MSLDVNPDDEFHVVLNGVVTALSLDALDAAYQEDVIKEDTLIWQEGFSNWIRFDLLLASLEGQESQDAPLPPVEEDVYFVMVAEGDVKKMSLDLLDDAYRLDVIDDDTLVWQHGYAEWIPLSILLGGQEALPHVSLSPSMPAGMPSSAPPLPGSGPPAPPGRSAPPPLPPSVPSPVLSVRPGLAPSAVPAPPSSAFPAPPSMVPSAAPAPPSSAFPAPSSLAPSASPSLAPAPIAANSAYPASIAPEIPLPAPVLRASPWYRRSMVALSLLSFAFILHRNGIFEEEIGDSAGVGGQQVSAAMSAGVEFQTPHGLKRWLALLSKNHGLDHLSETEPLPGASEGSGASADVGTLGGSKEEGGGSSEGTTADEAKVAGGSKKAEGGKAANFGARLSGKEAAKKQAPQRKTIRRPKKSKQKGSGLAYDPMNGAL